MQFTFILDENKIIQDICCELVGHFVGNLLGIGNVRVIHDGLITQTSRMHLKQ